MEMISRSVSWMDKVSAAAGNYRMRLSDGGGVFAVKLVGSHDGSLIPVGPIDPVFENSDGEWMIVGRFGCEDYSSVRSVIVTTTDEMHFGVDPKESFVNVIERDTVRPLDVRIDQHLTVRSVHTRALDAWRSAPIGPVEPSFERIDSDGSRLLKSIGQQRFTKTAIKVGDFNRVLGRICPVQMSINPINSQSVYVDITESDNRFGFAFVDGSLVDSSVVDVTPKQHPTLEMKVEGCRASCLVDNGRQITTVQREPSDIRPMGEKQSRVAFVSFATRSIVWISCIASQTFALKGPLFVDARLRARSSFLTLVDVYTRIEYPHSAKIKRQTLNESTNKHSHLQSNF